MHGLGNDYVYVDEATLDGFDPVELSRRIADRHTGIGADGLVVLARGAEVAMRMWNADGSESAMCGNALRCVARLAVDWGWAAGSELTIQTGAGRHQALLLDDGRVRVDLGAPRFAPAAIPMVAVASPVLDAPFPLDGDTLRISAVSMGNPHAVIEVDDVATAPVATLGPRLECDPRFPERTNVGFAERTGDRALNLRVWERGSGETRACGSGAAAAAVTQLARGLVSNPVSVDLPGGQLLVDWDRSGPVWLTGEAAYAFKGEWLGAPL